MGKIAVESEGSLATLNKIEVPNLSSRPIARDDGWSVSEVVCNAGPHVRPREEQHSAVCIAMVKSGSFLYQSSAGRELMTPGSLMLGNAGEYYQCRHEHGVGDHCIAFAYDPRFIEDLAADAGVGMRRASFCSLRVPPIREFSNLVSRAHFGLVQSRVVGSESTRLLFWGELAVELACRSLEFVRAGSNRGSSPAAEARVTRVIRMIESHAYEEHRLDALAHEGRLSRYHFLRTFQQLTGLTPHQYVVRARLRLAAIRLLLDPSLILDVAHDAGFGDVSNFNHAFRGEFGLSPRAYRARWGNTYFAR